MDKNKITKTNNTDVHIEQVNPRRELSDLEKTAVFQFLIEEQEKDLSKTQQLKILNSKKKNKVVTEFDLPKVGEEKVTKKEEKELEMPKRVNSLSNTVRIKLSDLKAAVDKREQEKTELEMPKRVNSLTDTIRIKLSDLRAAVDKREQEKTELEMPKRVNSLTDTIRIKLSDLRAAVDKREQEKAAKVQATIKKEETKKKSLYDTVIIKLDDIINNRKALKSVTSLKVTNTNELSNSSTKKKFLGKVRDITKVKEFTLNVDSEEFTSQLTNLNIIALRRLSSKTTIEVRKNNDYKRNHAFENSKVHKEDYLAFKDELIEFAIDKLYYQYALKETKKYKVYKFSVALSVLVFLVTSLVITSWFIQGVTINNLSNSLTEAAPVEEVEDGTLINVELVEDIPTQEDGTLDKDVVKQNDMYWKYLNTPLSSVDFTQLLKQNKDTVGWLIVNNTNINYPVVQTTNNDYYLKHAFDRSKNYAGWVYADFRNDFETLSKNTVIYAHGRKDGVMFGSLNNALKKNWYTNLENQIIQLSTLNYNTMWQIFSVYKIEAESYYITTDFSSTDAFEEFVTTMEERSIYDFGVNVTSDDRILTLSTCYNDKGTRLVVQAKLVKIQER